MGILKTFAIILLTGGIILWGVRSLPHLAFLTSAPTTPAATLAAPKPVIRSDDGPVTLDGTVTLDTKVTPQVPYLVYQRPDGSTRTKELILAGNRGCETQDGDLPCIAGINRQYPELNPGARVRISGTIKGDQILVTDIEPLS